MGSSPMGGVPPDGRKRHRRLLLGEMLVQHGVLSPDQLEEAILKHRSQKGMKLGRLLVELGYVTDVQICEALADQLQIPAADLVAVDVPNDVLSRVPRDVAVKYTCLPWFIEGRDLYLIMAEPTNVAAADAVAFAAGLRVKPVVAPESEILAAIARFYSAEETSLAQLEKVDLADQLEIVAESEDDGPLEEDAEKAAQGAPVVKLVNAIFSDAVRAGASDIHIEPQDKQVVLRYRVDGLLRSIMTMPKRVQTRVVSRVKIMAHMDISEHRKPQDGRTRLAVAGKTYDLRISTLPTADGEKIVIRILVQARANIALEELGVEPEVLASFKEVLRRPQGMILVTGPTGSGKTSTLYAALNFLKSETTNIVTVEDPIEYKVRGINQVAVSEKTGLTFAAGLRSILRQDPNVVMVGEIRDLETAQIAFQAAQTGHLVLSTLHTNDAPSAATRLVEMGVPAYLVASSVIAIQAQRLVRRLCDCRDQQPDGTATAKGCDGCRFGGFRGREAIYELMRLTPRVRSAILARASDDIVRRAAQASGMRTMYADGLRKVARGLTTLDEVLRVVPPDEPEEEEGATASEPDTPRAPAVPAGLSPQIQAGRRPRVLVVDDDPKLVEILKDVLESDNHEVLTAADGLDALRVLYRTPPDLIVSDVHMPGLSGIELLRRVRTDLSIRHIPVLLLTVENDVGAETRALDLGADDYIGKPMDRGRLLSRVRRALVRAQFLR